MSEFLTWHPSSRKGEELYSLRDGLIDHINKNPIKAIKNLQTNWHFGDVSEVWDDYIFDNLIRPVLDQNSHKNLQIAVERYSQIDHLLFLSYIRREESPIRFRRAFWNINVFGQRLSKCIAVHFDVPISNAPALVSGSLINGPDKTRSKKIAFVLKGPYSLAHVEFLHSFLQGSAIFSSKVKIFLILLDAQTCDPKDIDHVTVLSLSSHVDSFSKVKAYINYCKIHKFDHICWVACVQNLSLYMGMQLAPVQSYWSMKYHSIIMPTIQKYAGLGFGGNSFHYDSIKWFRGRAFPVFSMPKVDQNLLVKLRNKHQISKESILVGCFVRAEKLYSKDFWESVTKIIKSNDNIHFVIASQSISVEFNDYLRTSLGDNINRFHELGWVNTKKWIYNLDVYYDSYPRGSCNTIFEAIKANVPVIMADTELNRESSALPYLYSASKKLNIQNIQGILPNESERCNLCIKILSNDSLRSLICQEQMKLLRSLDGQQHLFAKDYLNYFLDLQLSFASL